MFILITTNWKQTSQAFPRNLGYLPALVLITDEWCYLTHLQVGLSRDRMLQDGYPWRFSFRVLVQIHPSSRFQLSCFWPASLVFLPHLPHASGYYSSWHCAVLPQGKKSAPSARQHFLLSAVICQFQPSLSPAVGANQLSVFYSWFGGSSHLGSFEGEIPSTLGFLRIHSEA